MSPESELQNSRRSFMKLVAAAPLFVSLGARSLASTVAASAAGMIPTSPRDWNNNIYTRFGIRPIINCRGVFTYLTASVELPQVRKAAEEASHFFIDLFELQAAVGRHLAKMSGAESGMITSGSAGSIACATAGCIAGSAPKNIYQLPDTTGMKGEVIIMGGRSVWDSCIRLTGVRLIVAPTVKDLNSAITSRAAMIYTTWHDDDRITQILKISKPAGVPLMVDQAAGIPPYSNFTRYAKLGVDLFCFSGGKGLMGPQVSGLLLGRKDLIDTALYNSTPWEGAICRRRATVERVNHRAPALDQPCSPQAHTSDCPAKFTHSSRLYCIPPSSGLWGVDLLDEDVSKGLLSRGLERQRMEPTRSEKLESAIEALRKCEERSMAGQFAMEVMHDIRNPLDALGNLVYLSADAQEPALVHQYMRAAKEQIATLHQIAAQGLAFACGTQTATSVDLTSLGEAAIRVQHRKITAKRIHTIRDVGGVMEAWFADLANGGRPLHNKELDAPPRLWR